MERCVCVCTCVCKDKYLNCIYNMFVLQSLPVQTGHVYKKRSNDFCFGLDSRWAWNRQDSLIVTDKNSLWQFPIPWNETKSSVCLSHHVVSCCHIVHKTIKPSKIAAAETYWEIHGRTARCERCVPCIIDQLHPLHHWGSSHGLPAFQARCRSTCFPVTLATCQRFVLEHLWQEGIWHTVKIRRNPAPPNM